MGACQCNQSSTNDEFNVTKTIESPMQPMTTLPRIQIVKINQINHFDDEVRETSSPFTVSKKSSRSRLSMDNLMRMSLMNVNGNQQLQIQEKRQYNIEESHPHHLDVNYPVEEEDEQQSVEGSQINSFIIRNIETPSPISQGKTTVELQLRARASRPSIFERNEKLRILRLQETEYTKDELAFMYMMHNQNYYKRENLQNPRTVEEMRCTRNPQKWKKRLYSNLDASQKYVFDETRKELDIYGMAYVSNNQIMRAMTVSPTIEKCLQTVRKTEENRIQLNLNDLQESEFEDLIRMNCFVENGSQDKEGRPILFLLMRNINLRKISVEHFIRYWVFVSDRAAYRMSNSTDELLLIIDLQGFGFGQVYTNHYKAAINIIQELYCGRNSLMKIVNGGKIFQAIKSVLFKFLTESAKENLQILDSKNFRQELLQYVEPQFLPNEYGGTMARLA